MSRTENIETSALRALGAVLVLVVLGGALGVQHIAYTRQMNRLSRQLQQRELELHAVTQAYRALESAAALRAAEEFRQVEGHAVAAKLNPRMAVPGG